jgi:hypothetical protein
MKVDATPWARQQLPPSTLEDLRRADPLDGRIHIGRGRDDWRALITVRGHVLADERAATAGAATARALSAANHGGN